jgi:hypothetical protein
MLITASHHTAIQLLTPLCCTHGPLTPLGTGTTMEGQGESGVETRRSPEVGGCHDVELCSYITMAFQLLLSYLALDYNTQSRKSNIRIQ